MGKSSPHWRGGAGPVTACGSAGAGARRPSPSCLEPLNTCPSPGNLLFAPSKPQTAPAISTDWKLHEYDSKKPAQGGKSRHRFLGRSRYLSRDALDEAEGRAGL